MKRPRAELVSAATAENRDSDGGQRIKKRKVEKVQSDETINSDVKKSELSKEERRELKKLRKHEREGKEKERRPVNGKAEAGGKDETRDPAKALAKAARKAKKAQLRTEKGQSPIGASVDGNNDGDPVAEAKAKRKAARKLEKEQNNTSRQTTVGKVGAKAVASSINGKSSGINPDNHMHTEYTEDPDLTALSDTEIESFLSTNFITIKDPSSQRPLRPVTKFSYLPESSPSSTFSTFSAPTAIQASAWPFLLSGRDVVGVAETGSGKTLAFGIPCIRSVSATIKKSTKPARAVIISPTRELAVQIHTQMQSLCTPANKVHTACVYGGVPKDPQRLALSTAHIIVATPGRLLDLIEEGSANLSEVEYLVLDEADRMLEKGFENEIRKIVATTPSIAHGRQTLMFTATWPESVRELAATFMKAPVHIHIGENNADGELRANTRIEQQVEVVDPREKETRMLQIIKKYQSGKAKNDRILVFCLYKKEATRVEGFLRSRGLRVAGIHGDLSQERRMAALEGFKSGECPLLVATDVAARGLDIPAVKLVLNVTFPLTVEDYVHRIGRTGRAGAVGLAITLFTEHDKSQSGALINVLKAAGQAVPEELLKFGTTVKKKGHEAYGAFYKDTGDAKTATKIRFD
ncbi:RNA-dependent ATPase [Xanthoria parietina]